MYVGAYSSSLQNILDLKAKQNKTPWNEIASLKLQH